MREVRARTSIEPEQERLPCGLFLGLKEPVEERPPVLLVHGDMAGEVRDLRALWLAGEECHPITLLLTVTRGVATQALRGEDEEKEKPSRCCCGHCE